MNVKATYFLMFIFYLSCSSNPTFDVRIVNQCQHSIVVHFASKFHRNGPMEQKIEIEPQNNSVVISTTPLEETRKNSCKIVASKLEIYRSDDQQLSNLKWCTDDYKFELVDIGQYQFLALVTDSNFN